MLTLEQFTAWAAANNPLDQTQAGMLASIRAARSVANGPNGYPLRKAIADWVAADETGARSKWIAGK